MQHEKIVQQNCLNLLRSVGASVYVLGHASPNDGRRHRGTGQTSGLGDVWFFLPMIALRPGMSTYDVDPRCGWLECKAERGRLSQPQKQFRDECTAANVDHVVGGLDTLIAYLVRVGRLRRESLPHYREVQHAD